MTNEHTFDWHSEPESSFLKHAMLWIVSEGGPHDDTLFNQLSEASSKFTDVKLGITVNGVEVDADAFTKQLEKAIDSAIDSGVRNVLRDKIPGLNELQDAMHDLETTIRESTHQLAVKHGVAMVDEFNDWTY